VGKLPNFFAGFREFGLHAPGQPLFRHLCLAAEEVSSGDITLAQEFFQLGLPPGEGFDKSTNSTVEFPKPNFLLEERRFLPIAVGTIPLAPGLCTHTRRSTYKRLASRPISSTF